MSDFWDNNLTLEQQVMICESVAGTSEAGCNVEYWANELGLPDFVQEELDWNFCELAEKHELFRCEDCGWWGDIGEIGMCQECGGELV